MRTTDEDILLASLHMCDGIMSQATTTEVQRSTETGKWIGAIGAGLAGGIVMGAVMAVLTPTALTAAIPAL